MVYLDQQGAHVQCYDVNLSSKYLFSKAGNYGHREDKINATIFPFLYNEHSKCQQLNERREGGERWWESPLFVTIAKFSICRAYKYLNQSDWPSNFSPI